MTLVDELIARCQSFDGSEGTFAPIVWGALRLERVTPAVMAEEFEAAPVTITRWAEGLSRPLPGMQRLVVRWVLAVAQACVNAKIVAVSAEHFGRITTLAYGDSLKDSYEDYESFDFVTYQWEIAPIHLEDIFFVRLVDITMELTYLLRKYPEAACFMYSALEGNSGSFCAIRRRQDNRRTAWEHLDAIEGEMSV